MKIRLYIFACLAAISASILLTACNTNNSSAITSSTYESSVASDNISNISSDTDSADTQISAPDLSSNTYSVTESAGSNDSSSKVKSNTNSTNKTENEIESGTPAQSSSSAPAEPTTSTIVHTHSWNSNTVLPTCTTSGYTVKTCSCGSTEKTDFVNALGHSWSGWSIIKQATVTDTGLKSRTCSGCGITEEQIMEKLPQTAEDWNMQVLNLVNAERAKYNLNPLEYYYAGQSAADTRTQEIKTNFSHTRPNGESCFTVFDELGIQYRSCGENIASGYRSPEAVMEGWMNSPGHRSNILNENYTHLIVGVEDYNWVQLFLKF